MTESPTVTLDHGDGGAITDRFVRDEILVRFGNPILNPLGDGARVALVDRAVIVTTDSFVVDPPIFPGGDVGKLAVSGTVNDLVACGAAPRYITLALILTEGLQLEIVRHVLDSIRSVAQECGVAVVAGDTKVLPRGAQSGVIINTTGFGYPLRGDHDYSVAGVQPSDDIILTGSIGAHALAVLSAREGLGFESRVVSDCAPLSDLILPVVQRFDGIHAMRDPTRGGLVGVLTDMTDASRVDISVSYDRIPIQDEVRYGCEMLGIDPLCLANEGKMVIAVAHEQTSGILEELRKHPMGHEAVLIGSAKGASSGNSGCLTMYKDGKRLVVSKPEGRMPPRLC